MVRCVFSESNIKWNKKVKIVKKVKNIPVYKNSFKNIKLTAIKENKKLIPAIFLKYNLFFIPSIVFNVKAKINRQKEG